MRHIFRPLVVALALAMTTSSCIGSFGLFKKLRTWNSQIGSKFVNELVFIAFWIVPVYEVAFLADILVINSIEFWSGSNPVHASVGSKVIEGKDGKYLAEWKPGGYKITSLRDKTVVYLDYDKTEDSWSLRGHDGTSYKLVTFVDDNHVALPYLDGSRQVVELSSAGLSAYASSCGE